MLKGVSFCLISSFSLPLPLYPSLLKFNRVTVPEKRIKKGMSVFFFHCYAHPSFLCSCCDSLYFLQCHIPNTILNKNKTIYERRDADGESQLERKSKKIQRLLVWPHETNFYSILITKNDAYRLVVTHWSLTLLKRPLIFYSIFDLTVIAYPKSLIPEW